MSRGVCTPTVAYASHMEFEHLFQQLKTKYAALVRREYQSSHLFLCTACWLHGTEFWLEFTKGAGADWCEMMNRCLIQTLESALYFGHSLEAAQAHFFDLERSLTFFLSDFVNSNLSLADNVPSGPLPAFE